MGDAFKTHEPYFKFYVTCEMLLAMYLNHDFMLGALQFTCYMQA
jgi:hypothetical protein